MKCKSPNCNNETLADFTDHICIECMDLYVYCPQCTVDAEPPGTKILKSARVGHVNHEEDVLTTYKFKLWKQSREAWKLRNEAWKLIEE